MNRRHLIPALGALALLTAAPSFAQTVSAGITVAYTSDDRQSYYDARRGAYDNGYREGTKQGEKDGRDRRRFEFDDEGTYRDGDKGYNRSYGDVSRYRQQFRVGYAAGYEEAYRRYSDGYGGVPQSRGPAPVYRDQGPAYGTGYPGRAPGYGYPANGRYARGGSYGANAARLNGVNDGVEKGREDARKGRSYDPQRHSWYRSGDHDYKSEYGPKDWYRNLYRDGFQEGYDRAYRDGSYAYR